MAFRMGSNPDMSYVLLFTRREEDSYLIYTGEIPSEYAKATLFPE